MAKKKGKTKGAKPQSAPPVRFDPDNPLAFFNHPANLNKRFEAERDHFTFNPYCAPDHFEYERGFLSKMGDKLAALGEAGEDGLATRRTPEYLTLMAFRYTEREPKDALRGLNCMRQAAEMGFDCAQAHYGLSLYCGSQSVKTKLEGLEYLEAAAEAGNAWAETRLGEITLIGFSARPPDLKKAVAYLNRAADRGYSVPLAVLGALNLGAARHPKNERLAMEYLRRAAEKGHGVALNYLGVGHLKVLHGLPKDHGRALALLTESAKTGFGPGLANLFLARQNLGGERSDWVADLQTYEWAAGIGVPQAMTILGQISARGLGGEPVDLPKAVGHFLNAAGVGHAPGTVELAKCFIFGAGLPPERERGLNVLNELVESGDKEAMFVLSTLYRYGYAVEPNPLLAFRLASKAGVRA